MYSLNIFMNSQLNSTFQKVIQSRSMVYFQWGSHIWDYRNVQLDNGYLNLGKQNYNLQ
jgi:hypothetical protein